ncbi:MAG: enoyl-CoA hydratase/isomerase family protein [Myxococcales bacterium]|nr:enoyl-CoA hydratase/isomerase family protein [Myxococcales bacterium]
MAVRIEGPTNGVLEWVFDRPERLNAINRDLIDGMLAGVRAATDAKVRAVLMRGEGRGFCAGGDVKAFGDLVEEGATVGRELPDYLHRALRAMRELPKPVLAAVHGPCAGAGFSLALASDLVIAADTAKFTLAYLALGTSPDGGSTWSLPRHVGLKRAMELFLSPVPLSAQQVAELGLVNRVVPAAELLGAARAWAFLLASGPTRAIARLKHLLTASSTHSLEQQLELESQLFAESTATADFAEGVRAFNSKRPPSFRGE